MDYCLLEKVACGPKWASPLSDISFVAAVKRRDFLPGARSPLRH
jgi:hypothetical protein